VRLPLATLVLVALVPAPAFAGSDSLLSTRLFEATKAYCESTASPVPCGIDAIKLIVEQAIPFEVAEAFAKFAASAADAANAQAFYKEMRQRATAIETGIAALQKKYPAR